MGGCRAALARLGTTGRSRRLKSAHVLILLYNFLYTQAGISDAFLIPSAAGVNRQMFMNSLPLVRQRALSYIHNVKCQELKKLAPA